MTFLEAAIEVLKREGKPLPTRKLAELAVKNNLLSVVGRDPEGTMQVRLDDAIEKQGAQLAVFLVKPGVYGLKAYPPRPYPAGEPAAPEAAKAAKAADAAEEPAAEGKKPSRRRRGGRGRGGSAAAESAGSEAKETAEAKPAKEAKEEEASANGATAEGERRGRRRSRRGGRGRRRGEKSTAPAEAGAETETERDTESEAETEGTAESETTFSVEAPLAAEVALDAPPMPAPPADDELLEGSDDVAVDEMDEEFDLPGGPVLAPAMGAEDVTRTDDEREVRAEILGRENDRGRRRRRERGRDRGRRGEPGRPGGRGDGGRPEGAPAEGRGEHGRAEGGRGDHARGDGGRGEGSRGEHRRGESGRGESGRGEHRRGEHGRGESGRGESGRGEHGRAEGARLDGGDNGARGAEQRGGEAGARGPKGLLEAAIEVMRSEGGRPMHVRHLTDVMIKRHLVEGRGGPNEVARALRVVLVREQREREGEGLRARVRPAGGGQWALVERRLDQELAPLERELAEKAARLSKATVAAMRRRIGRLPPAAFEALCRALVERLGVTQLELVRRGDGVVYYGGQRVLGSGSLRVLIALRAGEAEVNRRAVGELRAGLQAKGYDQGILLAAGRAGDEALAELKAGPGVTAYDGLATAELCARQGLGVRRLYLPVDYLDVELFSELTEN
jgi:hypothetical protein